MVGSEKRSLLREHAKGFLQRTRGGHLGANEPIVALKSPECGSEFY